MSIVGGWVLSGEDAERAIPAGRPAPGRAAGIEEVFDGPLWLRAPAGTIARMNGRYAAAAGPLPGAGVEAGSGQLALVSADAAARTLSLTRGAWGTQRLYFRRDGDVLFFGSRAKDVVAASAGRGGLDREAALEAVLSGTLSVVFGSATLFDGVEELRCGETLTASGRELTHSRRWNGFLEPAPSGDWTPRRWRAELRDATGRAIGSEGRAAISLSGGLDSTVIAVLAVEHLGAANVEAFTYEFQDSRPTETEYAGLVCRRLGIRHHVLRLGFDDYLASMPELFRRLEAPRVLHGASLPLARAAAERGFARILTGYGVEMALGIADAAWRPLPRAMSWLPFPERSRRSWRDQSFFGGRAWALLGDWLACPAREHYLTTLCVLRHNDRIDDVGRFYPEPLEAAVRALAESPRVVDAIARLRGLPLAEQLRRFIFDSSRLHKELGGKAAAYEAGAAPVCPAMLIDSIPGAASGGRKLHLAAFSSDLPTEIIRREKRLDQTVISEDWRRRITTVMAADAPAAAGRLADGPARDALLAHYPRELGGLGFWLRTAAPEGAP